MSDMLSAGVASLAGALQAYASVAVVYWRGNYSLPIQATTGTSLLKLTAPNGAVQITRTDADFIVPAASLVDADNNSIEPLRGDFITRLWPDGVTRRYRILPYDANEPLFRYSDPSRQLMRIHTKFDGTV